MGNNLGEKLLATDPEAGTSAVDQKAEQRSLAFSFCALLVSIPLSHDTSRGPQHVTKFEQSSVISGRSRGVGSERTCPGAR